MHGVTPAQLTIAKVDPTELDYWTLKRRIAELEAAGRPADEPRAGLAHKISGPISTLLMPLLAAVAAFGLARSGQVLLRASLGMALGFAYFVADNFSLAMGNAGAYPAARRRLGTVPAVPADRRNGAGQNGRVNREAAPAARTPGRRNARCSC